MTSRDPRNLVGVVLLLAAAPAAGQQTMGLFLNSPGSFDGYTLFEGLSYTDTYLIDNDGNLVHSWHGDWDPGDMAYLLENGNLIRAGNPGSVYFPQPGAGGVVQEYDWSGNLVWEFTYMDSVARQHHDIEPLPNGNVLVLAWETKSRAEAIAAGRDSLFIWDGEIWPETVIEVEKVGADSGNVVWEWHAWDHLVQHFDSTAANYAVVADHPELIDVNYKNNGNGGRDWMHANAIAYNADLDQIAISVNQFSEFWIIDHGTTTAEAAGHTGGTRGMGGDVLYRWGNPQTYGRGTSTDRILYRQHDVHWIGSGLAGEGHILLFNNGYGRPAGVFSSVEEIVTTVDSTGAYPVPAPGVPHGPAASLWTYTATPPESLYSAIISSAQRLPNGNTLICEGAPSGTFQEVTAQDSLVWLYVNPVGTNGPMVQGSAPSSNSTFRAKRYAPDYPGLAGRDLTPQGPIELPVGTGAPLIAEGGHLLLRPSYPNPARSATTLAFSLGEPGTARLDVYDVAGRLVTRVVDERLAAGEHRRTWSTEGLPSGVYLVRLRAEGRTESRKVVVLR